MDWIDIAVRVLPKLVIKNGDGFVECMNVYQYISTVDIMWEAVQQLHRVLFDTKDIPFSGESKIFKGNTFNQSDNKHFKQIRACFGAHPVNLEDFGLSANHSATRLFASWPMQGKYVGSDFDYVVHVYSNNPSDDKTVYFGFNIVNIEQFFLSRFGYLDVLIRRIDFLFAEFCEKQKKIIIQKSNDPLEQLRILKEENEKRLDSEGLESLINEMTSFFETAFTEESNCSAILEFREKMLRGIDELYQDIQSLAFGDLYIESVLSPHFMPREGMFGYEYAALSSCVFAHYKPFLVDTLVAPLQNYLVFNYESCEELYWLVIIALNMAQNDLSILNENDKKERSIHDVMAILGMESEGTAHET